MRRNASIEIAQGEAVCYTFWTRKSLSYASTTQSDSCQAQIAGIKAIKQGKRIPRKTVKDMSSLKAFLYINSLLNRQNHAYIIVHPKSTKVKV
jgi:hypothetical protein